MNIGALKKRIKFQSPVLTADGMGGSTVTWKDEGTVWASIWSTASNEAIRSGQLSLEITHRVRTRYRSDVDSSWRIKHGDLYYSIVSLINPNMENEMLDLLCKESET